MQQSFRKIQRVQPLIRLKKRKMDEEATVLGAIRKQKVEIVRSMKASQRRYMQGVEELNRIRASRARDNLHTLEEALDFVKAQWYRLYKEVQDVEQREKAQLTQVLVAERDLKAVEKLRERYEQEFAKEIKKHDQKTMDEAALRRFMARGE